MAVRLALALSLLAVGELAQSAPESLELLYCSNPQASITAADVWSRGDTGYDTAVLKQYAQYLGTTAQAKAKLRPALLVKCSGEAHVVSAIRYASQCGALQPNTLAFA